MSSSSSSSKKSRKYRISDALHGKTDDTTQLADHIYPTDIEYDLLSRNNGGVEPNGGSSSSNKRLGGRGDTSAAAAATEKRSSTSDVKYIHINFMPTGVGPLDERNKKLAMIADINRKRAEEKAVRNGEAVFEKGETPSHTTSYEYLLYLLPGIMGNHFNHIEVCYKKVRVQVPVDVAATAAAASSASDTATGQTASSSSHPIIMFSEQDMTFTSTVNQGHGPCLISGKKENKQMFPVTWILTVSGQLFYESYNCMINLMENYMSKTFYSTSTFFCLPFIQTCAFKSVFGDPDQVFSCSRIALTILKSLRFGSAHMRKAMTEYLKVTPDDIFAFLEVCYFLRKESPESTKRLHIEYMDLASLSINKLSDASAAAPPGTTTTTTTTKKAMKAYNRAEKRYEDFYETDRETEKYLVDNPVQSTLRRPSLLPQQTPQETTAAAASKLMATETRVINLEQLSKYHSVFEVYRGGGGRRAAAAATATAGRKTQQQQQQQASSSSSINLQTGDTTTTTGGRNLDFLNPLGYGFGGHSSSSSCCGDAGGGPTTLTTTTTTTITGDHLDGYDPMVIAAMGAMGNEMEKNRYDNDDEGGGFFALSSSSDEEDEEDDSEDDDEGNFWGLLYNSKKKERKTKPPEQVGWGRLAMQEHSSASSNMRKKKAPVLGGGPAIAASTSSAGPPANLRYTGEAMSYLQMTVISEDEGRQSENLGEETENELRLIRQNINNNRTAVCCEDDAKSHLITKEDDNHSSDNHSTIWKNIITFGGLLSRAEPEEKERSSAQQPELQQQHVKKVPIAHDDLVSDYTPIIDEIDFRCIKPIFGEFPKTAFKISDGILGIKFVVNSPE